MREREKGRDKERHLNYEETGNVEHRKNLRGRENVRECLCERERDKEGGRGRVGQHTSATCTTKVL